MHLHFQSLPQFIGIILHYDSRPNCFTRICVYAYNFFRSQQYADSAALHNKCLTFSNASTNFSSNSIEDSRAFSNTAFLTSPDNERCILFPRFPEVVNLSFDINNKLGIYVAQLTNWHNSAALLGLTVHVQPS